MSARSMDPWLVTVWLRRLLARSVTRRALVLVVAVATGLSVVSLLRSAEDARDRWGASRTVVVARQDLEVGEVVDSRAVVRRAVPGSLVAEAALTEVPTGAVVRQPVAAGEALVAERLAPDGLTGVAALVPADHRAMSIPIGPVGAPPVAVGDQVDVLAILPPVSADLAEHQGEGEGQDVVPIVERASVVDVRDEAISVAVPTVDAPAVAAVLTQGVVLLALAGA